MDTVAHGRYRFFSRAELDEEKAKYIAAVKMRSDHAVASGGGHIGSSGAGGQGHSFLFPRGIDSFEEWGDELERAYAQIDDEDGTYRTGRAVLTAGGLE